MMGFTRRQLLHFALRNDLVAFIEACFNTVAPGERFLPNWHIQAIAHQLERVLRGEVKRLIITLPPRSLKLLCASVALPAYILGRDPTRKVICVSYSEGLALKHANDCRFVMRSNWYRDAFQTRIDPAKDTQWELATNKRGFRLTTTVGGTLTGRGGNILIIDDPMKAQDAMSQSVREGVHAWVTGTLLSRLDNKEEDAIIVVMQRLHEDDLAGHLIEAGGWEVLNLPAIAEADEFIPIGYGRTHHRKAGEVLHPARESLATLERLKAEMGSAAFSAQYQQAPVPEGGNLIKREWLRFYEGRPEQRPGDTILLSWDTAMAARETADYSVCTIWLIRGEEHYLLDLVRERLAFPDLKRMVIALHQRWPGSTMLVEDQASGMSLIQQLSAERIPVVAYKPKADKLTRMSAQTVRFESGAVFLPKDAPWLDDLVSELLSFPGGRHDDQVDSISQALDWAQQHRSRAQVRIRRL
jgi:predicted phage terminase large subunit-like protein